MSRNDLNRPVDKYNMDRDEKSNFWSFIQTRLLASTFYLTANFDLYITIDFTSGSLLNGFQDLYEKLPFLSQLVEKLSLGI